MKKSLISLAVAAGLVASGAAHAAPTAYGFIDLSINSMSDNTNLGAAAATGGVPGSGGSEDDLGMSSNTSAFGLKGSEDLGDGVKALYKIEFQVDLTNRNAGGALTDRDQWVGLKGGMGKILFGTMSSNYKQMGGKIDPFYRTAIQARNVGQQSRLHRGAGVNGGRLSNAFQYTSPSFGGISVVLNRTIAGAVNAGDETMGIGVRYKAKGLNVWLDTLSSDQGANGFTAGETATKVGAKYKVSKELTVGGQMEMVEDALAGGDVMFLSATYGMDKNNTVAFSYGSTDDVTAGFSLGLWHKMSKMTSVYAAMNSMSEDTAGSGTDGSIITVGMRKKF